MLYTEASARSIPNSITATGT